MKRRLWLALGLLCMATVAQGQYCGQRLDTVTNAIGQAISNASVTYYSQPSGSKATVYSSTTCGTAAQNGVTCTSGVCANPQVTNGLGQAFAYLSPGLYTVVYSGPQIQTQTLIDQLIPASGSGCTVSGSQYQVVTVNNAGSGCTPATVHTDSTGANLTVPGSFSTKNNASIGPRYDVTQYGAVGNGVTDDTAAIQSAFTACYANGGGFVEFPGAHAYLVSGTIYPYDTCSIEGVRGSVATSPPSDSAPLIYWAGANTGGNTASVTAITVTNNQTAGTPLVTAMDPGNRPASQLANFELAVTANNSFTANEWVALSGCTYLGFNNVIAQVASANSTSFTAVYNGLLNLGTYTETCTATQATVVFAFDSLEHETDTVSNISFNSHFGSTYNAPEWVDLYFSGRTDAGNNVYRTAPETPHFAAFYYAAGGEETKIMDGSRSDSSDYYQVYFRNHGTDKLTITNSQFGPNVAATHGATTGGGAFLIDNEACAGGNLTTLTLDHMVGEDEINMTAGLADITFLQCPTSVVYPQFKLNANSSGFVSAATGVTNIQVLPASDTALSVNVSGASEIGNGVNTTNIITGVPTISLMGQFNLSGYMSSFTYSPPLKSWGITGAEFNAYNAPAQFLGDSYFQNLYQFTVPASLWLGSDTAFAALPSGTTLLQGNVLAPPAYFNCGSGSGCGRYAIDVVQGPGTVGTLNGGSTTCSAVGTGTLTCSSATGLMIGQYITTPTNTTRIQNINATNPSAVLVSVANTQGTYTNQAISYGAPTLGKEMQLPTKFTAAPTAGTWAQGDIVWNSGVSSGGTCYWINTAAGTPGTWLAVSCTSGFANPMTTLGDIIYGGTSGAATRLAGSTSSSTLCLTQTGTGSVSAAPIWGSCAGSSATAFSAITGSTNTTAAMVVGTGASLAVSGSGTIQSTSTLTGAYSNSTPYYCSGFGSTSASQQSPTVMDSSCYFEHGAIGNTTLTLGGSMGLFNPGTATGSQNFSSEPIEFISNYWNGSASTQGGYELQNVVGTGTNPTQTLTLSILAGSTSGVSSVDLSAAASVKVSTLNANTGLIINGGTTQTGTQGTDTKLLTTGGTFTASNMACGDANGGVTNCTTTPTGMVLGNGVTATTQSAADNSTKVATTAYVDGKIRHVTYKFEEGAPSSGTALTTGVISYVTSLPVGCTITGWDINVDAGTATVQTWKVATGTANPASGNSISTSGVSISTGTAIHSTTVTDFTTTSVSASDIFAANLSAVSGADYINFQLELTCAQ